jgi:hypothetical protein
MYFNDFERANNFTKSLGLEGTVLDLPTSRRYLQEPGFVDSIAALLDIDQPEELMAKCNIVSQVVCEAISINMTQKAYLTIVDVDFSDKAFFDVDENYFKTLASRGEKGLQAQEYRHHAWVTLDSMEVIDFTLNTSMAMLSKDLDLNTRRQMLGGIMTGHADHLKGGVRYRPVLIGEAFYLKYDSLYPMLKSHYLASLSTKPGGTTSSIVRRGA